MTDNEKLFRQKVEKLTEVYVAKNKDYGDSFSLSLDKYGILASLIRMGDKMNRIDSLYDKPTSEVDESLVDSLEDLANYAIMTAIWLENQMESDDDVEGVHNDYFSHEFDDLFDDVVWDDDHAYNDDDIERQPDWNDGWHNFDGLEDDETDDFSMDGLPKFRIVRRPKGGLSSMDYLDILRYLYEKEGD